MGRGDFTLGFGKVRIGSERSGLVRILNAETRSSGAVTETEAAAKERRERKDFYHKLRAGVANTDERG
jgi:hypothetical protein